MNDRLKHLGRLKNGLSILTAVAKTVKGSLTKQIAAIFPTQMAESEMLRYIEEAGKYVEITGFRNLTIKNTKKFVEKIREESLPNSWIQFFNPYLVATWEHLYFAVLNAIISFSNARNISKSMPMEAMLYASAQRQIQKALGLMGIKPTSADVAIVVVDEKPDTIQEIVSRIAEYVASKPDETILEITEEKISLISKVFEINKNELETIVNKNDVQHALVNLVIERMALMSTRI